jgi:AcrR family transcriptional regulator
MSRRAAPERREQIIGAAVRVLLAKGLAAATTRDVTSEIGVGAGLLNHYFGWHELRAIAFERIARDDLDRVLTRRAGEPANRVLTDLIETCFEPVSDPIWRVWIEAYDLASHDPALARCVGAGSRLWRVGLADLLARGTDHGHWSCPDPEGSSWRLIALLDGLAGLMLVPDAALSRTAAREHLSIAFAHECRGWSWPGALTPPSPD